MGHAEGSQSARRCQELSQHRIRGSIKAERFNSILLASLYNDNRSAQSTIGESFVTQLERDSMTDM